MVLRLLEAVVYSRVDVLRRIVGHWTKIEVKLLAKVRLFTI